jgi:Na+-transporting methylmalonyl-CoA/oxaloacetate decarboxylase gamma subunit
MNVNWDLNATNLLALFINLVVVVVFAVKTASKANAAYELAERAQQMADRAHAAIAVLSAALSLHREQVAEKYVDRTALREMEQRLTKTIENLGERLDHREARK